MNDELKAGVTQPAVIFGNAQMEGAERRGWFIGHFIEAADLRGTDAIEVKWAMHTAGEKRLSTGDMQAQWSLNEVATTLSILIRGRFRLIFPDQEHILAQEGDYVFWAPGVPHTWLAEEDSVVLTVRYPSRSGDSVLHNQAAS